MPKYSVIFSIIVLVLFAFSCRGPVLNSASSSKVSTDSAFRDFETRFLDAYWQHYPSSAVFIGYGKYYERLVIPDSVAYQDNSRFSTVWLDSLKTQPYSELSDNLKISYRIIENQLQSDKWYNDTLKQQEWNPASFNITGESYYIYTQPYAPLDQRLRILSQHITNTDRYYKAALRTITVPTREHTELGIKQNEGGLDVFGFALTDSIAHSGLSAEEKDSLRKKVVGTVIAIKNYVHALKNMLADKKTKFRSFRLGKELYDQKFHYDLVTSYSPEELFRKSEKDKIFYQTEMYRIAQDLWPIYTRNKERPKDSLALIQFVIDQISLHHAQPSTVIDTLKEQVHSLQKFVIDKNLFNYDSSFPLVVRIMPAFQSGVSLANADFVPPYQKSGATYFNVDDLTRLPGTKAESTLREYNNYSIQFLTIHEAMPGHCLQGIYSNTHTPDIIKAVFQNGTMIEGWAVYAETMMLENGWGNHSPEMQLIHDKWKLRELGNAIIDYRIHCLNESKENIESFLKNEAFQTPSQVEEKWHRATVSQVQLCSYYAGMSEIMALREDYKNEMGTRYSLKDFHERFLSYGSAPIKYIREMMVH
ncbi:MAG: DUF885 domain-containing protein [Bacteroidetes bacterium]|nr:MAG: DUF885 domain-containing protein [Bacteroidota bacterium]